MEQKHLDEDSFFTEEFIDEDDLLKSSKYDFPDERIDPFADEPKQDKVKKEKKEDRNTDKIENLVKKDKKYDIPKENKSAANKTGSKPVGIKEVKPAFEKKDEKKDKSKEEPVVKSSEKKEERKEDKKESSAKTEKASSKPELFDPWKEEKNSGEGLFKEASTWKAITGIMLILLIFSILTGGFKFSEPTGGAAIPIQDADDAVLNYVNTNLLQFPYVAELEGSEEVSGLYKVGLSVAGQQVDSYVTKDGKLFFPQGFDMTKSLLDEENSDIGSSDTSKEEDEKLGSSIVGEEVVEPPGEVNPDEGSQADSSADSSVEEVSLVLLNAKRWVFTPNRIEVNKGNTIQLHIVPEDLAFTFSMPELNIEKEINGRTLIEFKADQAGEFTFSCSSCDEWRGMSGKLVVK